MGANASTTNSAAEERREAFNTVVVSEEVVRRLTGSQPREPKSKPTPVSSSQKETESAASFSRPQQEQTSNAKDDASDAFFRFSNPSEAEEIRYADTSEERSYIIEPPAGAAAFEPVAAVLPPVNAEESFQQMLERERALQLLFAAELEAKSQSLAQQVCGRQPVSACRELEQSVIDCYAGNPRYSLRCGDQARRFADCVERHRLNIITTDPTAPPQSSA